MALNRVDSDEGGEPIGLDYAIDVPRPPSRTTANWALGFGIAGVTVGWVIPFVFGLLAVIVGATALLRIRRRPDRHTGRNVAIVGVILGVLGAVAVPLMIVRTAARARDLSLRVACAANLRGLGQAMYIYAQAEPDGAFPDNIDKVITAGFASPKSLRCPMTSPGKTTYYYVPGRTTASNPESILIFEVADDHFGDGGNVLYQDGRAMFVDAAELRRIINAYAGKAVPIVAPP